MDQYLNRVADLVEWRREDLLNEATQSRRLRQLCGRAEEPLGGLSSLGDLLLSFRIPVRSRQVP